MKYDFSKVSKESMVEYFQAYYDGKVLGPYLKKVSQEAEVKLRTRSEVDADIAKVIRDYHSHHYACDDLKFDGLHDSIENYSYKLNKLCKEETEG